MKVLVSLVGLIFFVSGNGFAQRFPSNQPRQNQNQNQNQNQPFGDPFDLLDAEMNNARMNWPNNSGTQPNVSNGGATVSIQQLQHKVSKQAMKEYKKGRNAYSKGDYEGALSHLQNAIQLDPEFADGHNDLGVVLGKLGNTAEAAEQFQKAINLSPDHSVATTNLCLILYMLRRYQEVVPLARRALKNDPGQTYVRYVLAMSIVAQRGDKKEALDNLERAATRFPEARLTASQILAQTGRRDEAVWELEEYLRSVPNTDPARHDAEVQLAQLRQ